MFKRIFVLLFTIVSCVQFVFAGTPVIHITSRPNWLATYQPYNKEVPARDVESGFFFLLSEQQINIEKQEDYSHAIRQIVSQAGIQNGSAISVSFDPSYQRLDFHEITVWRNGKPQNRLTPNLFKVIADEQELDKFIYQGSYSAYCTLPDIRKGDRIEFSYTITGTNPVFNNKFCRDFYLQGRHTIAHTFFAVITQPQHQLNFKSFYTKSKFSETAKNGLKYYTIEDFQTKPAHDYDNQPSWYSNYAQIQISDFNSWSEVVNWALAVNPAAVKISGKVAAEVASLKTASKGDMVKYFREAVKFVQDEVRYMGIETGEYSHRANTPENVLNHRYGDCKDKSLLLATLLNADNIPANLVLINTRMRQKTSELLPAATDFNHAVVTASVNGKQMWIDPTISYQRGTGLNLYFPTYGQGLILKPGNNVISNIPLSPFGKIKYNEDYTIKSGNDTIDLKVVTKYTLDDADDLRQQLATNGTGGTEKNYLEYYQKNYPKAETADSLKIIDDEEKNEITTIEHYAIPDYFKKDSTVGKREGSLFSEYITSKLSSVNAHTEYPVALNYPTDVDYTANIVLPSGWLLDEEKGHIKRDSYEFTFDKKVNADTLALNYHFKTLASFIPLSQVEQYRKDALAIESDDLPFNFSYSPQSGADYKYILNWWMTISVIIFIVVLAVLAYKIYTKPTPKLILKDGGGTRPIGGWLIFFGIILGCFVLVQTAGILKSPYFNLAAFKAHDRTTIEYGFKALFTFESFVTVFFGCTAIFCLVLYFKKRDIFPLYTKILLLCILGYYIIDYLGSKAFLPNLDSKNAIERIIRSGISAAIWITYLKRSSRVKETFIVPHPQYNFAFENDLQEHATQPEVTDTPDIGSKDPITGENS